MPGKLRPMGDQDDLLALGKKPYPLPNGVQGQSADARIHLVEEQGRQLVFALKPHQGKKKPGELSARSDLVQRLRRLPRVGHPEHSGTVFSDPGGDLRRGELELHAYVGRKSKTVKLTLQIFLDLSCGFAPGPVQRRHGCGQPGLEFVFLFAQPLQVQIGDIQKGEVLFDLFLEMNDLGQSAVQLAPELRKLPEPRLDALEIFPGILPRPPFPENSAEVLQGCPHILERSGPDPELLVKLLQRTEQSLQFHEPLQQTGFLVIEHRPRLLQIGPGLSVFADPFLAGEKFVFLAHPGGDLVDLSALIFQKLPSSLQFFAALPDGVHLLLDFPKRIQGPVPLLQKCGVWEESVQDPGVKGRPEQALLGVLAGVHEQGGGQLPDPLLGAQPVVDKEPAPAGFR